MRLSDIIEADADILWARKIIFIELINTLLSTAFEYW